MNKRSKTLLIVVAIIIIVSATFVLSQINGASAQKGATPDPKVSEKVQTAETNHALAGKTDLGSPYWALVKLLGALVVVVAAIYGFIFLLRKMMGQKISGNRNNNLLEVMETAYIGQKKSVSLIRFSDRAVLVGIGDNNISVLAELSQDETAGIMERSQTESSHAGFKTIFNDARDKIMKLQFRKSGIEEKLSADKQTRTA